MAAPSGLRAAQPEGDNSPMLYAGGLATPGRYGVHIGRERVASTMFVDLLFKEPQPDGGMPVELAFWRRRRRAGDPGLFWVQAGWPHHGPALAAAGA